MFDVLPPSEGEAGSRRAGRRQQKPQQHSAPLSPPSSEYQRPAVPAGSRVVQLNWKLPARLRKPIREQLRQERLREKQRQAIIRFERRPIDTRSIGGVRHKPVQRRLQLPKRRVFNRGAEHHTGDTYKHSKPKLQVMPPPYVGGYAKHSMFSGSRPKAPPAGQHAFRADASLAQPSAAKPEMRRRLPARRPYQGNPSHKKQAYSALAGERDVPMGWGTQEAQSPQKDLFVDVQSEEYTVAKPKHRLSLPFSISVWPKFFGRSSDHSKKKDKKPNAAGRNVNIAILVGGFALLCGLVWNLQGAGRGFAVLSSVESRTEQAFQELMIAQAALAQTDFETSEESFAQAELLLRDARNELTEALAASRVILRTLDITGTVRSGEELLVVGEHLTVVGQHVTRGLSPLLHTSLFDNEDTAPFALAQEGSNLSLVEAVVIAQEEFRQAEELLREAEKSLSKVNTSFLPADITIHVEMLQTSVPRARELFEAMNEQGEVFLYLLGAERDRQYLILFANNHEIRPVGGFIGTVGLVNIDRGKVENIDVQSVYDPDGQMREFIAPPNPLLPIVDRWFLRDSNWFVDFEVSARKAADFFEKGGGPTVDGVLLMTPQVITRLLAVTGPIMVPGYDVEVSAENFIAVTQEEVTYLYDQDINKPKQFLADLTPILLNRLFSSGDSGQDGTEAKLAALNALAASLQQKDMVLYFRHSDIQGQIRELGWAGTYPEEAQGFLGVNNANIGGHKSDQFIEQEIDYRTEIQKNGDAEVTVTIRRTHRGPAAEDEFNHLEEENPATKDNIVYQRVLVPHGAELIDAKGYSSFSEVPMRVPQEKDILLHADVDVALWQRHQTTHRSGTTIGTEAGYTFFANWMITEPGETSVGLYRYTIPRHAQLPGLVGRAGRYSVFLAKQPGDTATSIRASILLPKEYEIVHTVPSGGITAESSHEVTYRGFLRRDMVVGAVLESGA